MSNDDGDWKYSIDDLKQDERVSAPRPTVGIGGYVLFAFYLIVSNGIGAVALGTVLGYGPHGIASVYIALAMNFLGAPLALFTDVFQFPLWTWYVIVLSWSGSLLVHRQYLDGGRNE